MTALTACLIVGWKDGMNPGCWKCLGFSTNMSTGLALNMDFSLQPRGTVPIIDLNTPDWKGMKFCLEHCNKHHNHTRNFLPSNLIEEKPAWVIDVDLFCLKTAELIADLQYVALSYVWGALQQPSLTSETMVHFQQPGAFKNKVSCSQTVRDAMEACSQMSQRYLWISVLFRRNNVFRTYRLG
jgi:hypothetical protein